MTEVVSNVVYEVIGRRLHDLDQRIIDYIVNVLADEDFDFGMDGEGAVEAHGELLVVSGCVYDDSQCRFVCSKLSERFGKHGLIRPKPAVRCILIPVRMFDGMEEEEAPKKKVEVIDGPVLTGHDPAKIQRRKRKDDRKREMQYQMHLQEMEATKAEMPVLCVSHDGGGVGPNIRDLHLVYFSFSVGGRELIVDGSVALSFGRHYGLVGRNGTGKTSFLRHLAMHAIDSNPKNCQVLHAEQEVLGDTTSAFQCVFNTDLERILLLEEEARLLAMKRDLEMEAEAAKSNEDLNGGADKDVVSQRLEQIYIKLEHIDGDTAEAHAASILAGLSLTLEIQKKPTEPFSGGQRMQIALARALFIELELLLLDEPMNHLDLHAVHWLEAYILKWKKTFIVVSHAREFLYTVVTDVLHLKNQKPTTYKGDYDTSERTCQELIKYQQKAFESNEKSRAHMQTFINKFLYNAKRASLVQSRIKALNLRGFVDDVVNNPNYKFEFRTPDDRPGSPVISFSDASFGYSGGPVLFNNDIDFHSPITMVKVNVIAKSIIVKFMAGKLQRSFGTAFRLAKMIFMVFCLCPLTRVGGSRENYHREPQNYGWEGNWIVSTFVTVLVALAIAYMCYMHTRIWKRHETSLKSQCKMVIGVGRFGTIVFKGPLNEHNIAIKRFSKDIYNYDSMADYLKDYNRLFFKERNILAHYKIEKDDSFIYMSLELGMCNLEQLIHLGIGKDCKQIEGIGNFNLWRSKKHYPSDTMLHLLRDVVKGLHYMHRKNIIHKRLKPRNVLITKNNNCFIAKICDPEMNNLGPNLTPPGYSTNDGWLAPEVLNSKEHSPESDIFSLGCLVYFCMKGTHAFGKSYERNNNIINNEIPTYEGFSGLREAKQLLRKMLMRETSSRIKLEEIMSHPFFWTQEKRILFLVLCSKNFEDKSKYKFVLERLERHSKKVFHFKQWNGNLDANLLGAAVSSRRYNYQSVQDLLRLIKDLYNCYSQLDQPIKRLLGPIPKGFHNYFEERFPELLLVVYETLQIHGVRKVGLKNILECET